jgi:hypothetical protein
MDRYDARTLVFLVFMALFLGTFLGLSDTVSPPLPPAFKDDPDEAPATSTMGGLITTLASFIY